MTPVPAGRVATIVTSLEMRSRPRPRPVPDSRLRLVRWPAPPRDRYRALFRRVGTPWLWYSRLVMADAALDAILADPRVEIHAVVDPAGIEIGMVELDFRDGAACEIVYFALVPELAGQGHGRWLMAATLARAWRPGVARVWVHTCTLDHPSALGFYRAQGFVPFRREIETFADPRLSGLLPPDAAPHVPVIA
jgi:GNAT superfamily N-acetyltransferase